MKDKINEIKQWMSKAGIHFVSPHDLAETIEQCFNDLGLSNEWVSVEKDYYPARGCYVDCIDKEGVRVINLLWDQNTEEWLDFEGGAYSYNYFEHWIKSPLPPKENGE